MNQPFSFRQRIGQLNWKQISSLNIEEIIQQIKITELQQLLDNITFSEITFQDLKQNNISTIQLLLHIMQLMIEYLLYHQEQQYSSIHSLQKKIAHLKTQRDTFQQQIITNQEDIKTYRRQLHILRKAVVGGQQGKGKGLDDAAASAEEKHGPRIIYPLGSQLQNHQGDNTSNTKDIIRTLVEHEHDSRRMMASLLEEQRQSFNREIIMILDSIKQQNSPSSMSNNQQMMASFQLLMENMKLQLQQTLQSATGIPLQNTASTTSRSSQNAETLKGAALKSLQEDLERKERQLAQREEILRRREEELRGQDTATSLSSSANRHQVTFADRFTACKSLFSVMQFAIQRQKSRYLHHWHTFTLEHRHQEYDEEQRQHLLYATTQPSSRELELERLYDNEREKTVILQAKLNTYQRELEQLKESVQQSSQRKHQESQKEQDLQTQLKQLQEKNIILSARLNTNTNRYEKEKQELLTKIQILEKMITDSSSSTKPTTQSGFSSPPRRIYHDTATNISKDFSLGALELPKKIFAQDRAVGESVALPKSKDRYSVEVDDDEGADEYDLLENALARISSRNDQQTVEQLAIATLTQEFMTKFHTH